jgi:hypothetical protein
MTITRIDLINQMRVVFVYLLVAIAAQSWLHAQSRTDRDVCPEIVTTLVPQRVFKTPTNRLLRLEIRSCMPGETENLQFVGWEGGATKPSLILTTSDETIVQIVMSGGVFVIETTGGSHDTVFAIVYEGGKSFRTGKPRVALQAVTKGSLMITTNPNRVLIDYPDLRGEHQHFEYATGIE